VTDRQTDRQTDRETEGIRKLNLLGFNEARDNEVAVASAGPYANQLHLTSNR